MGDVMTKRLLDERAATEAKMAGIETVAVEQKRDLTEADIKSLQTYRERLKALDAQLDETTQNIALAASTRDRVEAFAATSSTGTATARPVSCSGTCCTRTTATRASAYDNVQQRAAQHMGTTAEVTVATAGGFGGLIVSADPGARSST
jgi:hypothetical protein